MERNERASKRAYIVVLRPKLQSNLYGRYADEQPYPILALTGRAYFKCSTPIGCRWAGDRRWTILLYRLFAIRFFLSLEVQDGNKIESYRTLGLPQSD